MEGLNHWNAEMSWHSLQREDPGVLFISQVILLHLGLMKVTVISSLSHGRASGLWMDDNLIFDERDTHKGTRLKTHHCAAPAVVLVGPPVTLCCRSTCLDYRHKDSTVTSPVTSTCSSVPLAGVGE